MKDKMIPMAIVAFGAGYLLFEFGRVATTPKVRHVAHFRRSRTGIEDSGIYPPPSVPRRLRETTASAGQAGANDFDIQTPPMAQKKPKSPLPNLHDVVFHDDPVTTPPFVMEMLTRHFKRSAQDAASVTEQVDTKGRAVANAKPMPIEVAETRKRAVEAAATHRGYPFRVTLEKR